MNGMSCWAIQMADARTVHVHADRVWVDQGCLVFSEERPNAASGSEQDSCLYATAIIAAGQWVRAYAASIVDGSPLSIVCYPAQGGSIDEGSYGVQPEDEAARHHTQP